jgi:hypothetical protein
LIEKICGFHQTPWRLRVVEESEEIALCAGSQSKQFSYASLTISEYLVLILESKWRVFNSPFAGRDESKDSLSFALMGRSRKG